MWINSSSSEGEKKIKVIVKCIIFVLKMLNTEGKKKTWLWS